MKMCPKCSRIVTAQTACVAQDCPFPEAAARGAAEANRAPARPDWDEAPVPAKRIKRPQNLILNTPDEAPIDPRPSEAPEVETAPPDAIAPANAEKDGEPKEVPPTASADQEAGKLVARFCAECGGKVREGAAFCGQCGSAVAAPLAPPKVGDVASAAAAPAVQTDTSIQAPPEYVEAAQSEATEAPETEPPVAQFNEQAQEKPTAEGQPGDNAEKVEAEAEEAEEADDGGPPPEEEVAPAILPDKPIETPQAPEATDTAEQIAEHPEPPAEEPAEEFYEADYEEPDEQSASKGKWIALAALLAAFGGWGAYWYVTQSHGAATGDNADNVASGDAPAVTVPVLIGSYTGFYMDQDISITIAGDTPRTLVEANGIASYSNVVTGGRCVSRLEPVSGGGVGGVFDNAVRFSQQPVPGEPACSQEIPVRIDISQQAKGADGVVEAMSVEWLSPSGEEVLMAGELTRGTE